MWLFVNKLYDKRTAIELEKILQKLDGEEAYTSLFNYPQSIKSLILNEDSVSSYSGDVYGEWMIFDFDGQDLSVTAKKIIPLLSDLEKKKIHNRFFFSGKKGFHLYIPKCYFFYQEEYEKSFHILNKYAAILLAKLYPQIEDIIDLSIYKVTGLIRLPFSNHGSTNQEKRLLRLEEYNEQEILKSFVQERSYTKVTIIKEVFSHYDDPDMENLIGEIKVEQEIADKSVTNDIVTQDYFQYAYGEKKCIYRMLNNKNVKGSRHQIALRLQSYWREKGYPKHFVTGLLKSWNSTLEEPLDNREMFNVLKYSDKVYKYTCNDQLKARYCLQSCPFYNSKTEEEFIFNSDNALARYRNYLSRRLDKAIDMKELYPEFPLSLIEPTHVVTIAGGPGSGKTTIALNLMYHYNKIYWIYISLEMAGTGIIKNLIALSELDIFNPEQAAEFDDKIKHITIIDKPSLSMSEIEGVIDYISEKGENPTGIIVDYLKLIKSDKAHNTEKLDQISDDMKRIAKKKGVFFINLSQVPKNLHGSGNLPLGLESAKDSGEIVNLSDKFLTVWRPNKGVAGRVDDTIRIKVCKDRQGFSDWEVPLEFIGAKYQIKSRRNNGTVTPQINEGYEDDEWLPRPSRYDNGME